MHTRQASFLHGSGQLASRAGTKQALRAFCRRSFGATKVWRLIEPARSGYATWGRMWVYKEQSRQLTARKKSFYGKVRKATLLSITAMALLKPGTLSCEITSSRSAFAMNFRNRMPSPSFKRQVSPGICLMLMRLLSISRICRQKRI